MNGFISMRGNRERRDLIARLSTAERKLVFLKVSVCALKAEIKTLNKIIEKILNLPIQPVSNDVHDTGDIE